MSASRSRRPFGKEDEELENGGEWAEEEKEEVVVMGENGFEGVNLLELMLL